METYQIKINEKICKNVTFHRYSLCGLYMIHENYFLFINDKFINYNYIFRKVISELSDNVIFFESILNIVQ